MFEIGGRGAGSSKASLGLWREAFRAAEETGRRSPLCLPSHRLGDRLKELTFSGSVSRAGGANRCKPAATIQFALTPVIWE